MDLDLMQFLQGFFEESLELLDNVEQTLGNFEEETNFDKETINQIFRCMHSIKGGSGTFGLDQITKFTHVAETYLDLVRNDQQQLTQDSVALLLESIDWLRSVINALQENSSYDEEVSISLVERYNKLIAGENITGDHNSTIDKPNESSNAEEEIDLESLFDDMVAARNSENEFYEYDIHFKPKPTIFFSGNDPLRILNELKQQGKAEIVLQEETVPVFGQYEIDKCFLAWTIHYTCNASEEEIRKNIFEWVLDDCDLQITQTNAPSVDPSIKTQESNIKIEPKKESIATSPEHPVKKVSKEATKKESSKENASIRVATDKLDALINMVGELVITQSMISQYFDQKDSMPITSLREGLSRLEQNSRELQECVMRLRMLPISNVFNRFPRMVREMSSQLNKKVQLKITGENTEIDKIMLEKIVDPLVHLVRNSIDHGLEQENIRTERGKDPIGTITLAAYHEGGSIVIDIIDDGNGLNKDAILKKAIEKGLATGNENFSNKQIFQFIFDAGFSTAEKVSEISGRGVGMDVVRKNIEQLSGTIDIQSKSKFGTTVSIRLPLTLAIIDGQLIRVGKENFVMPLGSLREIINIKTDNISTVSEKAEMYFLRGQYISIIKLYEIFGIQSGKKQLADSFLLVIEVGAKLYGIVADELLSQQQVVIKSLEHNYMRVEGITGATILGDGAVALILDATSLIRAATKRYAMQEHPI